MKTLCILNDPPYGTERSYNALRLTGALVKRPGQEVRVFLLGDASVGAKRGQTTPPGYYNVGRMVSLVARGGGEIGVCGSCMDARGLSDAELEEGARRSTLEELAEWVCWADKVLVF
jgi:uncharacterized protein involved in oxidation of intracellular sulfur